MSVNLNDAQLVMMSAAAQREDRCLATPDRLKGAAISKVSAKLVKLGLAREIRAKLGTPIWRRDEAGLAFALKLTAAGLKAIAVDEGSEEAIEPSETARPRPLPEAKTSGNRRSTTGACGRPARRQQAGAGDRPAAASRRRDHRRSQRGYGMAAAHDAGGADRTAQARV